MSRFYSITEAVDARNYASPAEIVACFRDQRSLLDKLAFLITARWKKRPQPRAKLFSLARLI